MKRVLLGCALIGALMTPALFTPATADEAVADSSLYILTLDDAGTAGYSGRLNTADYRRILVSEQDAALKRVGVEDPVYRWTTALSGVAVELDSFALLRARLTPGLRVERDTIRPVAGTSVAPAPGSESEAGKGGQGTVIGFVDTGIAPDTPVFANSAGLGDLPDDFTGTCEAAESWSASDCNAKIAAATWFVKGFGADNLRSGAALSPRDDAGHGTQVASVAAGNADVSALAQRKRLGNFSGTAPDARIAVYKTCWSAPNPADDGCSTADVVSAIDQAVQDGVDVLNLSITGSDGLGAVDRALLGAAEADIVVTVAAGNNGTVTGSEQPWMTTVGATTGRDLGGELQVTDGPRITGILTSATVPEASPIILAANAPAPGYTRDEARLCTPGALDAAKVGGQIVVCERGTVARIQKSSAVALADGVGMILVNDTNDELGADFHSVPTLHVSAEQGKKLRNALTKDSTAVGTMKATSDEMPTPEVLASSSGGSPTGTVLKPDLVAHGFGVLAASSPLSDNQRWRLLSGTSAATARVSGLAARVRAEHPEWSAARVRSALITTAQAAVGDPSVLRQGSGVAVPDPTSPGLVLDLDPSDYRSTLTNATAGTPIDYNALNLPSIQVASPQTDERVVVRTVTNVSANSRYYSSEASGFDRHKVTVTPAALRIPPGESRQIQIHIPVATKPGVDSGVIVWRGADETTVRIPVFLTR